MDTSDASTSDPVHDFEVIRSELAAFSPALLDAKPTIVVATKLDATTDRARLERLRDVLRRERAGVSRHFLGFRRRNRAAGAGDGRTPWNGWRRRRARRRRGAGSVKSRHAGGELSRRQAGRAGEHGAIVERAANRTFRRYV